MTNSSIPIPATFIPAKWMAGENVTFIPAAGMRDVLIPDKMVGRCESFILIPAASMKGTSVPTISDGRT